VFASDRRLHAGTQSNAKLQIELQDITEVDYSAVNPTWDQIKAKPTVLRLNDKTLDYNLAEYVVQGFKH
jgi:hypothetical protein